MQGFGGPCAEILWWALELVFGLKQNKFGAFKIILCAYYCTSVTIVSKKNPKIQKFKLFACVPFIVQKYSPNLKCQA